MSKAFDYLKALRYTFKYLKGKGIRHLMDRMLTYSYIFTSFAMSVYYK